MSTKKTNTRPTKGDEERDHGRGKVIKRDEKEHIVQDSDLKKNKNLRL